ncbi:MAG: 3-methyl-2-oxobutanoate hydroxymethyltransferase [Candidatus Omnitrophica bacterium]|nr:3-methyl-2-oxobutanoate hydroxymethyltransferase [Candidatus Omnitrophota bacterium]
MPGLNEVLAKKSRGEKIVMLTAYDYSLAVLLEKAGVDIILVGDSLANVVLGLEATSQVGMAVMLHHTQAVLRGVKSAPVVADMPFDAYQPEGSDALKNAEAFMAAGCAAVKVEWFGRCLEVVAVLVKAGVPVIGHVGLTPQTVEQLGGFKVQGRTDVAAEAIREQSRKLEQAGCVAVVLECVPEGLARQITAELHIPVIGIGAGKYCDGQVLVVNDMLGLYDRKTPKFVKKYADIGAEVVEAVKCYKKEVEEGVFPGPQQTFL